MRVASKSQNAVGHSLKVKKVHDAYVMVISYVRVRRMLSSSGS